MRVLVSGATGLVGSALLTALGNAGHQVVRLVRSPATLGEDTVHWDPAGNQIDASKLEGLDAVVHLAGENIAGRRWSAEQKARIRDSRVRGTTLLCETLARLKQPPRTLVAASAIGYYGDRGDEWVDEASAPGTGFLPDVCREWESATTPSAKAGIRVANLRIGVVLSPKGGALAQMLTPFRLGLGGRVGSGRQYMSWIALDDLVSIIMHALTTAELRGPVNAVAPGPVTNAEFTKTLGRVLGRPTIFPLPAFVARAVFGELADALLLASTRVRPKALTEGRFPFRYGELEAALRHALGR